MKILIHNTDNLNYFTEFFDFNQIEYVKTDLWTMIDPTDGQFLLPYEETKQLTIIDVDTFVDILSCDLSYQYLLEYLNNRNLLWVGNNYDATIYLHKAMDKIKKLDLLLPENSVLLWMDALPIDNWNFKNINQEFNLYTFVNVPRIKNTISTKKPKSYDFFVTCVLRDNREHRSILKNALQERSLLLQNSLRVFRQDITDEYVGDTPHWNNWNCGFPSMDIYSQSFIEIVPETKFKDFHFITEKTVKPIATKTPFLTVSTPGYLDFLKSLGFKTFDSLIDESYDKENDIHLRVEKILDTLESIVKQGTHNFYNASTHILDYNYNKLCELSSKKQTIFDHAIYNQLNTARYVLQ